MEGYRRQIAYLYAYQRNGERQSLGFAKLEVRERTCRLWIEIKGVSKNRKETGKIYIYFHSHNQMIGIYLGELEETDERLTWQGILDSENIQEKGIRLIDTKGIWICLPKEQDYVAEWEDAWVDARRLLLYPRGGETCIRCPRFGSCERSTQYAADRRREIYERGRQTGQKSVEASRGAYRMCHRKRR